MNNIHDFTLATVRGVAMALAALATAAMTVPVHAQESFPSRPVELIVNFGPGGGADRMGRTVGRLLESNLGVSVPVSNVSGSSGNAGLTKVKNSKADGYTIGTITGISISNWASGIGRLKVEDFTYVGVVQLAPSMFFVPYDSPFATFQDVLDHAKANPGKLKVATAGYGTLDDIAIRFFASKGYEMVNVPYAKPAERYAAAVGKHTDLLYEEPGDVDKFLSAKKLRSVVVFDTGRHPAFPDVPTARELGYRLEQPNWRGIVGPAGIAKDRAMVLNEALAKSVGSDDWHAFCDKTFTCAKAKSPEESIEFVRQVYDDVARFIEEYGLKKQ